MKDAFKNHVRSENKIKRMKTHSEQNYLYFPYVHMGSNELSLEKGVGGMKVGGGKSSANGICGAMTKNESELIDD